MKQWTAEERAAHGEKIRAAKLRNRSRSRGRVVILSQGHVARTGKPRLHTEIDRALEAIKLVDRIGWENARELAGRMRAPRKESRRARSG